MHTRCRGRGRERAGVRPRRRAGGSGVPATHGLERRRGARRGRGLPGAPADPEGARDRAPGRAASRRGRLPAPDRARARGGGEGGFATDWPGVRELLDAPLEPNLSEEETELRRIEAGVPRWGREIDERILPAEAGLDATHVSFSKGCYPGQEPVARLRYRGHPNRRLRVVDLDEVPEYDAPLVYGGREVGRVTSAARREDGSVVALAYVRTEVPDDAPLALAARAG